MINNIKKNTTSKALAKQKLNALNKIKKAETKNRRLINGQKILLNLFDDLMKATFNNDSKTVSKDNNKIVSEDNNKIVIKYNSINNNDNNNNDNDCNNDNNNNDNDNKNDNENDDDYKIKEINNIFKKIDETKSFEEQINLLKEMDNLCKYWYMKYDYDKELNLRILKLKYVYILEDLDKTLFEEIFGHTFVTVANKLMNTTSKEENQMLVNDIEKNKDKIYEQECSKFVIQPAYKSGDLIDAVNIILRF